MTRLPRDWVEAQIGPLAPREVSHVDSDAETGVFTGAQFRLDEADPPEPRALRLEITYWQRDAAGVNTEFPLLDLDLRSDEASVALSGIGPAGMPLDAKAAVMGAALERASAAITAIESGVLEGFMEGFEGLTEP